ncbi:MAG: hypothetical protein Q7R56_03740 [Nanoarchaeota archaeon]|nr:hypothetical protein [Nanoarchaeota archaeon]
MNLAQPETRKKTLEKEILEISFPGPLDKTQIEILCLFLTLQLPVSVSTSSSTRKTWCKNKPCKIDEWCGHITITQENPQTELTYLFEQAHQVKEGSVYPTEPRSYREMGLVSTTPRNRSWDWASHINSHEFRGFSPAEESLARRTQETVQTYFREHF